MQTSYIEVVMPPGINRFVVPDFRRDSRREHVVERHGRVKRQWVRVADWEPFVIIWDHQVGQETT
jgi:hypothetical protein